MSAGGTHVRAEMRGIGALGNVVLSGPENYIMRWNKKSDLKEVVILPIVIAATGTSLANVAEGAILAASVYLVSRAYAIRSRRKSK